MQVVQDWLMQAGWSQLAATVAAILVAIALSHLVGRLLRAMAKAPMLRKLKRAKDWQEAIVDKHVLTRISRVITIIIASYLVMPLLAPWPDFQGLIEILFDILLILSIASSAGAVTTAMVEVLSQRDTREQRLPFKALGQALQLTIWTYASVALLSIVTDKDVMTVLTGLTAIGAVLVYVFRDPLLGWSAGMQVAANDLVRVGDWISVPKHHVDGIVEEIALTTVKVRNWDRTTGTIPTYSLISEGFQNWRGMYASKVRRIKRAIPIDVSAVRFCDEELLVRLGRDPLIQEILQPAAEVENEAAGDGLSDAASESDAHSLTAERLTNLGLFRAWLQAWLKQHPKIEETSLAMVRELAPEGRGIPVEIYAFSKDQRWEYYERLQAEIVDHAIAVLPEFGLRVFQEPTGDDLRAHDRNGG